MGDTPPTHPHTYIISTMASSMMALRSLARTAAPRAAVRPAASLAVARRFASSSSTQQDPKAKANALIDALPGNSLVSKTGILTLGTAISAVAISKELFVVNEEVVVLASFTILIAFLAKIIRAPYSEWAESQIERIKGILNQSRSAHTQAVQSRIDSVGEMKDVVGLTEQLFALSKETAQLEHETFVLKQKTTLAAEIKATLDSWVRHEAQQREAEQVELVKSVQDKVLASLKDQKTQKEILAQAVADIEGLVKAGKV